METTQREVLQFVAENDVKFIRLAFCDIFGFQKNIAILADQLEGAFAHGISFDPAPLGKIWQGPEAHDLLLFPDPATLAVLPWRPQQGRVARFFCDIRTADGQPFAGDCRAMLRRACWEADQMGYSCQVGPECEFYLFEADDRGQPTTEPHDHASYLDIAPLDKGENVRREICLNLEEMGITPISSHHEMGPGQNEVDFRYSDALSAADNLVTFKSVVKSAAARNGLYASFLPKPLRDEWGSGLHINLSLRSRGCNLFERQPDSLSPEASCFLAGVLRRVAEITLFLNPLTNSYQRFEHRDTPRAITWSWQDRSHLLRVPAASGEFSRMELRSPDPAANPYLAFSLLLLAGLEGIRDRAPLQPPSQLDMFAASPAQLQGLSVLPGDLRAAADAASGSDFVRKWVAPPVLEAHLSAARDLWERYHQSGNKEKFERETYFYRV